MILYLDAKEAYSLFLESDFWRELSDRKRDRIGKCERCGMREDLQSHHLHYPQHWFDVREEDLMVLCRKCHEEIHGLSRPESKPKKKRHKHKRKHQSKWKWHYQKLKSGSGRQYEKYAGAFRLFGGWKQRGGKWRNLGNSSN